MTEQPDSTERVRPALSRMPDDAEYWVELAARVENRAAPVITAYANRGRGGFGWIGDRSPALAASALVAAALAWLLLPPPEPATSATALDAAAGPPSTVARALLPTDPLIAGIMTDPVPPTIASLLGPLGEVRR